MNFGDKASGWEEEDSLASTPEPGAGAGVSALSEELPALTATTVIGVTVLLVLAVAVVFVLGVFIDCRQQRILENKINEAKRAKKQRRANTRFGDASASIADNMEPAGTSAPPAEALRHIP